MSHLTKRKEVRQLDTSNEIYCCHVYLYVVYITDNAYGGGYAENDYVCISFSAVTGRTRAPSRCLS